MRVTAMLFLSLFSATAQAGLKQACAAKSDDQTAYANCIEVERKRAANTLRDFDPQIMQVLYAHTQESGSTKRLDSYRKSQASHVHKRNNTCKQKNEIERAVCEGDMDNAQIRALQKYLKKN